jgi:SNF2 family DNA or RNA helicase
MTYLLHPSARAVILPHSGEVLASIHSAREAQIGAQKIVVVPFNVWEAQALRARGIRVPSPIGYYYDWPRDRTLVPEPFHNQKETAGALTLWHRGYCLSEMGVGKTLSAMWAAEYLMRVGMIRRCLVMSPLSTIERVWGDAVFAHFRGRSIAILHGTAARRRKLLAQNHDFYVINHEALDIICDVKKKIIVDKATGTPIGERVISADLLRDDIDHFIIDELGGYRSGRTQKWRTLKAAIKPKMWAWGLTGTPTPNEPADAWAQCNLITPWTVPSYFTSFRQMTMQKLTEHIWVPLDNAPQIVHRVMQPSIRFTRDQCYDLPPRTYSSREVPFTDEQQRHYKAVAKELYTEINGGKIAAVNQGVKLGKLLQIACGVVLDSEGNARLVDCKPRVKETIDLIEQAGHKVIVFVPFRAPLVMLTAELERLFSVAMIHGDVPVGKRNTIFAAFQNAKEPRVLVADAGCMSHGLTLTEASTIIWYGPEYSNDIYTQANDRITRSGQVNAQHILHLVSCEAERRLYKRLQERARLQGLLLDLAKEAAL